MKKSFLTAVFMVCCATSLALANEVDETLGKNRFVIQSGAFTDPDLADAQAGRISLLGVPSRVVEKKNAQGNIVRVVRSKRMTQEDAERVAERLTREHDVAVLLMLDN
ncbi:SPOR domain-containing protein [Conchiformibius kuhniae]|uniref:SPOR domain-containing protein n=1 Tax=Conchiformibius kuhniae TaxID=211502 RepID=A0A8T9MU11_9NEIS|nr:SPOR domain-containing protein [Conchiformibius kuhniae]UOP04779.1 SPOR domain-containing protein [Conchiformibius kuhniae]